MHPLHNCLISDENFSILPEDRFIDFKSAGVKIFLAPNGVMCLKV